MSMAGFIWRSVDVESALEALSTGMVETSSWETLSAGAVGWSTPIVPAADTTELTSLKVLAIVRSRTIHVNES